MTDTTATRVFDLIEAEDGEGLRALLADDPAAAGAHRADGLSAVRFARYQFALDALDVLLAAEPHLDVFDAAAAGQTDALRAVLDADPSTATAFATDGFTALGQAAFFGHLDGAELLLARGARVNDPSRNPMRVIPLHSSLAGGHDAIAERLIAAGSNVNAVQADGYTPLHEVAQNGNRAMAERLLAAGADPRARLDSGATPADSARRAGHAALADYLDDANSARDKGPISPA